MNFSMLDSSLDRRSKNRNNRNEASTPALGAEAELQAWDWKDS
jgi:hypothetical protein